MVQFESTVKHIPYSQERVYNKLSDLSNLESVRDRLDMMKDKLGGKIEDLSFDRDSLTLKVQGINLTLRIIEREPMKCVKFEGDKTPVPLNLWIQILPVTEAEAKIKVTIRAEVNMFMKAMISKPLQEGVERLADMLAMIPYLKNRTMAQKLWEKSVQVNEEIDRFTVGKDRELDLYLAKHDVLGSMAHITMLESIGLLSADELQVLLAELKNIYASAERGEFVIEDGIEDVHSQVELMLTRKLGDVGKKIHSGRSRNDQVLVDLKLFTREQLKQIAEAVEDLFHVLISQSNKYKGVLMPGYTHLQIAMPSSFGLWFGAYAESLVDDMMFLQAAYKMCNRNPLGSAAGYGSSFPLDREMTTRLLGFDSMNYNVVYAQMGRGKMERNVAFALASIAGTISKMAFDACMFSSQNFGFVKLPDECTTGSSIMPHKKNPDVFELTRAKCNKLQSLPQQIMMIMNNLPSGYFRDLQIIKEVFLPAFEELKDCLRMSAYIMDKIKVNEHILDDDKYLYIFSVEEVNRLAAEGMPFRDAYKKVGLDIEAGKFTHNKQVHHTHAGSIGNLCNDKIVGLMEEISKGFNFSAVEQAEKSLLGR